MFRVISRVVRVARAVSVVRVWFDLVQCSNLLDSIAVSIFVDVLVGLTYTAEFVNSTTISTG